MPKEVGIAQIQRNYVDLALLVEAIELKKAAFNNSLHYDVILNNQSRSLTISFDIYTMNPGGFHIGYEVFEAKFPIVPKYDLEKNNMHNHEYSGWLVWTDDFDLQCTEAPNSETCDCTD